MNQHWPKGVWYSVDKQSSMLKDRVGPSEIIIEIQPYKVEPDIKFEIQITAMKTNMKCKTLSHVMRCIISKHTKMSDFIFDFDVRFTYSPNQICPPPMRGRFGTRIIILRHKRWFISRSIINFLVDCTSKLSFTTQRSFPKSCIKQQHNTILRPHHYILIRLLF